VRELDEREVRERDAHLVTVGKASLSLERPVDNVRADVEQGRCKRKSVSVDALRRAKG